MYNDTHTTHVRAAEGTEHAVFRERDAAWDVAVIAFKL